MPLRLTLPLFALMVACSKPTVIDAGGPVIDMHTHCRADDNCQPNNVASLLKGELKLAALSVQHFGIANALNDEIPDEVAFIATNNEKVESIQSERVMLFPSLECLSETSAMSDGFTDACLAQVDDWISRGAKGFKDHSGKAWDGEEGDLGLWVGAYNRLAALCVVDETSTTPNQDCQAQSTAQMPLDNSRWREMVKGIVDERALPLMTHAVTWREADTFCGHRGEVMNCYEAGVLALLDFALWAQENISADGRRRIIIAHAGFMDKDDRLRTLLDAGFSIDLAQTALTQSGCALRRFVAEYPNQMVFGTDIEVGQPCAQAHYNAWLWALLGEADVEESHPNTCRGTLRPKGAALSTPGACGVDTAYDLGRAVLYSNAARMLGFEN